MASSNSLSQIDPTGEEIDIPTFEQILEMDDDEDEREFSRGIVYGFFEQAEEAFGNMDKALKEKALPTLSSLGHFLKGSSATLGLSKVRDSCEKIQHFGARMEADGNPGKGSDDHYLGLVQRTVDQVKGEYKRAEAKLKTFYGEAVEG